MLKYSFRTRIIIFSFIALACILFVIIYSFYTLPASTTGEQIALVKDSAVDDSVEIKKEQTTIEKINTVVALLDTTDVKSAGMGKVKFVQTSNNTVIKSLPVLCSRMYYADKIGICLKPKNATMTQIVIFREDGKTIFSLETAGIPSRTRISNDGLYGAVTTFIGGGSYSDASFATNTIIIDMVNQKIVSDLSDFIISKNNLQITQPNFNFWGITFVPGNSDFFYASLDYGGVDYLIKGQISTKRAEIVIDGVECPSISPDGTKIVFKKYIAPASWKLAVLDLKTLRQIPLTSESSIDDQAEWLDDKHVLYGLSDKKTGVRNIMITTSDGKGVPEVFIPNAFSPAVDKSMLE